MFHKNHPPNPTPAGPIATLSRAQARLSRYVASLSARPRPLHPHDVAHSYALPLLHLRRFLQNRRALATSPPDLIAAIDRFHLDGTLESLFGPSADPSLFLFCSPASSLGGTRP